MQGILTSPLTNYWIHLAQHNKQYHGKLTLSSFYQNGHSLGNLILRLTTQVLHRAIDKTKPSINELVHRS